MIDLTNKTPEELQNIIAKAQTQLEEMQRSKYKEVVAQIKELAASVGYTVELTEISPEKSAGSSRKGSKVAVKYRNPENPKHQWTGRGMQPKWLRELIEQGRSLEEFSVA